MAGLQLKVTPAGRAAIVNLPNTGTNAVLISHIGVTATAFDPATLPATLPGELKRLTTFAGQVVANDTIHVTLRDDTADTYSMRGFALYLADGTLFALYGQAAVILEKSPDATLLLATDTKFADIDATSIEFGDANFVNPAATTEVVGVTRYATNAEAATGEATNRSITASALKWVIDQRFGVGAPSAFVKTLLGLTTAALIRTALEIKSAAMSEASDFAAASHGHGIAGITGLQAALDGKQPSGSYAAASHTHAIANVTGLQSALDGKQPAGSYAAAAHSHDASHIATGVLSVDRIPSLPIARIDTLASSLGAKVSKAGDVMTGDLAMAKNVGILTMISPNGATPTGRGYRLLSNVAENVDFGFQFDRWTGAAWVTKAILNNGGFSLNGQMSVTLTSGAQYRASANGVNFFDFGIGATTTDDPDAYLVNRSNGGILIYTNNAPRGKFLANGVFEWYSSMRTKGGAAGLEIEGRDNSAHTFTCYYQAGSFRLYSTVYAGDVFAVTTGGEAQAIAGFRHTSSLRVKTVEGANPYGLAEILKLETVVGRYREGWADNGAARRLFLIAENVAEHIDGPVANMEGVEFEGAPVLGLDHNQVIPVLVKAIQELHAEVVALKGAA